MTRQEQLSEIGNMQAEKYGAKFIVPVPHKFYKNSSDIFEKVEARGWKILNKHLNENGEEISKQFGAFNIKTYIYENMIPHYFGHNAQEFLDESKTVVLNKVVNQKMHIAGFDFILVDIDLWIFEEYISFFTINIDIDQTKYSVDELILFNRSLRNFKFLSLVESTELITLEAQPVFKGERYDVLEKLLELTRIEEKSFLNIEPIDCQYSVTKDRDNELFPIYNSSANAKLLTAVQTKDTAFSDGVEVEPFDENLINHIAVQEMSILDEAPFYLASCSSMQGSDLSFIAHDDYIYALVDDNGYNLWKYSSGITLHDSCAFIGMGGPEQKCGPLVANMQSNFYFVYMLNLYINFQIRHIEHQLIDENFESIDINYWYKKLQKLKNQFITSDIAIKFQENEVHSSISTAFKSADMLEEVTDNLMETKEITQNNRGIYMTLFGFIFVTIFQEPIQNFVITYSEIVIPISVVISAIGLYYRKKIFKLFKQ